MSDDLLSLTAALQLNNYLSIATATAIAYDYVTTFVKEINYVWNQPWTWVSTLFVVVRYAGCLTALIETLYGSTFIPGPTLAYVSVCLSCFLLLMSLGQMYQDKSSIEGTILIIVANWGFVLFLAAADLVMILRVYAMYQGSRTILGVLLLFYASTIILLAVSTGYNNNPKTYLLVSNPRVLNATFCSIDYTPPSNFGSYAFIPRFILAALMFIFSFVKFFMESLQAYKVTKQWTPNRYITLLVREGVLYFSAHLLYNVNSFVTGPSNSNSVGIVGIVTDVLSYIFLFILSPRFIISVREMYERDGHRGGQRGSGIDSGFGLPGQWQAGGGLGMTSIRFADADVGVTTEQVSVIQLAGVRTTEC